MKRFKLPDALGGGEYEEYRHSGGTTEAPVGTVAFLENGCIFTVSLALLTEVKSAMPEPPHGSVVRVARRDDDPSFVAERDDSGHGADRWFRTDDCGPSTWDQLTEIAESITPLVPDPFAEPVELPWEMASVATHATSIVDVITSGPLEDDETVVDRVLFPRGSTATAYYTPTAARAKARALMAAADVAERAS